MWKTAAPAAQVRSDGLLMLLRCELFKEDFLRRARAYTDVRDASERKLTQKNEVYQKYKRKKSLAATYSPMC